MRNLSFLLAVTTFAVGAFTLAVLPRGVGADRHGSGLEYYAYLLLVAADQSDFATPTTRPSSAIELGGGCTRANGHEYSISGVHILSTPKTFFYGHTWVILPPGLSRPTIDFIARGSGGWSASVSAPVVGRRADFQVQLPPQAGPVTVEIPSFGDLVAGDLAMSFQVPGDCAPLELARWIRRPASDFPFRRTYAINAASGNCAGFGAALEITINNGGALDFYQPGTGDRNAGALWPAAGGGYDFVVRNKDHPEAYAGWFSSDFSRITGQAEWNDVCLWLFTGQRAD